LTVSIAEPGRFISTGAPSTGGVEEYTLLLDAKLMLDRWESLVGIPEDVFGLGEVGIRLGEVVTGAIEWRRFEEDMVR
jgi:hypothetical protein